MTERRPSLEYFSECVGERRRKLLIKVREREGNVKAKDKHSATSRVPSPAPQDQTFQPLTQLFLNPTSPNPASHPSYPRLVRVWENFFHLSQSVMSSQIGLWVDGLDG